MSFYQLYRLLSLGHGNEPVICQRDFTVKNRDFAADTKTMARALIVLGIQAQDIILVASKSLYQAVLTMFAANCIGAVVAFLDNESPAETLMQYVSEYGAKILVTNTEDEAFLASCTWRVRPEWIINIHPQHENELLSEDYAPELPKKSRVLEFGELAKIAQRFNGRLPIKIGNSKNAAVLAHSSGSTDKMKPIMFSNYQIIAGILAPKKMSGIKLHDQKIRVWRQTVPLHYVYGLLVSVLTVILGGGIVLLTPDLPKDSRDIARFFYGQPDIIMGTPTLMKLATKYLPHDVDCSNLKKFVIGGDKSSRQEKHDFIKKMRKNGAEVIVCDGYGASESFGCISTSIGESCQQNTAGRICPSIDFLILDKTMKEVKYGQPGNLYVRGKHVVESYYKSPELDKEYFKKINGKRYFKTGDTVSIDESGYLTFIGRGKAFFIDATHHKIWYELSQNIIAEAPFVDECAIVPKPDDKMIFVCQTYIVLKDGVPENETTRQRILDWATEHKIIGNALPTDIVFLPSLPRTKAGKIDKKALKALAQA